MVTMLAAARRARRCRIAEPAPQRFLAPAHSNIRLRRAEADAVSKKSFPLLLACSTWNVEGSS